MIPFARPRLLLALSAVVGWQIWAGLARPGSLSGPAGEMGLCLALAIWWLGGPSGTSLAFWGATLLSGAVLTGVAPLWMFLVGWPAWLCTRIVFSALVGKRFAWLSFVVVGAALVTLCRSAGKLLLLTVPWGSLGTTNHFVTPTLSGLNLLDSLWAEAAPNLFFLLLFGLLLGVRPANRSAKL